MPEHCKPMLSVLGLVCGCFYVIWLDWNEVKAILEAIGGLKIRTILALALVVPAIMVFVSIVRTDNPD